MTGRASLLRRLQKLEDLAAQQAAGRTVTPEDIEAALDRLETSQLEHALSAFRCGRWPDDERQGAAFALSILNIPEGATGPQEWARACLTLPTLPPLPEGTPEDLAGLSEDFAAHALTRSGEEKTLELDRAYFWAFLSALASVIQDKAGGAA